MSLISKLKIIIEGEGLQFLYDSGGQLEELIERADFENNKTVVFAFLLSDTNLVDGKENGNVGLFFSKLSEPDFDSFENDNIQDECKQVAWSILKAIDTGNILTYSDVRLQRFYDTFHANVTGVAVNAVFFEMSGLTDCFV